MDITIERYLEDKRIEWDQFVSKSINGTLLHYRSFFDHNPLNKLDDCSFMFRKGNKIVALIACNLYEKNGRKILHSHQRATYGGFVVDKSIGVEDALAMVSSLITMAKSLFVDEIIVRNPFRIMNSDNCDESDYAMWYNGFSVKSREIEVAIKLSAREILRKGYTDTTLRNVKKGAKSLTVEQSKDFVSYWTMLEENLMQKHNQKPTHTIREFQDLLKCVGEDRIKLFVSKLGERMVAGIVVFVINSNCIHAQYIASNSSYQEYRPLNFLIEEIAVWGHQNGFRYFNLGMANEDGGKTINSGLFRFKEGFGGRGVLRETMVLNI